MRKYLYFVCSLLAFVIIVFSSNNVSAATSNNQIVFTTGSGNTIKFEFQNWTNQLADEIDYIDDASNNSSYINAEWNLVMNAYLSLSTTKYYNGWARIIINFSVPNSSYSLTSINVSNIEYPDGAKVYCGYISGGQIYLYFAFDNYKGDIEIPVHIEYKVNRTMSNADDQTLTANFGVSASGNADSVYTSDGVLNNRFTELLYSSIYQATGQNFLDIIDMLSAIKNQDLSYYNSIVNSISILHSDNIDIKNKLESIRSDINTDFASVQAILDLFPSYRTQVLQYWQELLQMNASQSSAAAEVESAYQDKQDQSATLAAGMSVNIPSYNAQDFNILSNVDTAQQNNFFGLLGLISNNGFISTLLLIAVTGMIVGFILYGKKD